eukprot:CAMPEP_0183305844 /NCGR_PEP_ID=MMETSP0160_2-20130417/10461_1 /TAXON_ID=2839 ORGANISM="Odontella Sinensis, Strain Grunow 1884" /NCGR_SAMPLE_ID=MMETSP0160_2 /ASSEMBLY_ACC=CAM_ASM_000250 /LENGTH=317 /DNA_ID=CAMNT_0025469123 /DNA_START=18 /DNA_END=971 /DNA_ORIENTATION=-
MSTGAGPNDGVDDIPRVVLEQTLLRCEEVFVYRIPPLATAKGHHAEDWNLAKPLETCSLRVVRVDDSLYLRLMTAKPKPDGPKGATEPHLFAQSHIRLSLDSDKPLRMEHWVEACIDTSRYFVVRISDERMGREAHIGMGFRERTDASDFKMSLQDYEGALRRERKAEVMHLRYETQSDGSGSVGEGDGMTPGGESGSGGGGGGGTAAPLPVPMISKLSLKEGEKIHINLKGGKSADRQRRRASPTPDSISGKGSIPLLKKPPPATSSKEVVVSGADKVKGADKSFTSDADSAVAVADDLDISIDDEEEWGEFESST